MSRFRSSAALKSFGLAAFGYLVVLAAGVATGRMIEDDGFAGLGLIALTTVILAPLGAVIGGYVGLRKFGHPRSQRLDWRVTALIAVVALIMMGSVEAPLQMIVALFALLFGLVLRSGLEARPMPRTRPRPTRKVPLP